MGCVVGMCCVSVDCVYDCCLRLLRLVVIMCVLRVALLSLSFDCH